MKDFYYILGVNSTATEQQLKSAYRKLSKKFHPDKNDGDKFFEERFKNIQEAYEILADSSKRELYDLKFKRFHQQNEDFDTKRRYEEEFRKKYEEEFIRREEEIKKKYQSPEQIIEEETERIQKEKDKKRKYEQQKILIEIDRAKNILSKRENTFSILQKEIQVLRKQIRELYTSYNELSDNYKNSNSDMNNLKYLITESNSLWNGKKYKIQVIELLETICTNKRKSLDLISSYRTNTNSDLISDLKKITSSYKGIAELLDVFMKFDIVEVSYPHNVKSTIA